MKDAILKIINEKIKLGKDDPIMLCTINGKTDCASELAEMMKEFNEWKDERLSFGKILWVNGFYFYAQKYTTHGGLFNYWHEKIWKK